MNYNYILSTGTTGFTGVQYSIEHKNNIGSVGEEYLINRGLVTGRFRSLISLNSQTMLEANPTITSGTNSVIYDVDSGDYFLDFERRKNQGVVFFDSSIRIKNDFNLIYDVQNEYTGVISYSTGSHPTGALGELVSSLEARGELAGGSTISGDLFTGWYVFVNGQKLPNYNSATGLPSSTTGKFFAVKKPLKIYEYDQTGFADVYGQPFVPNQVDFYINGMEEQESLFIQTYTGVKFIATGLQGQISLNNEEDSFYNL